MTVERRRLLAVAFVGSIVGIGLGLQAAQFHLGLTPNAGLWVAALAGLGLLFVLRTAHAAGSPDASAPPADDAGWTEFRRELRRSRRGVRPMTLLRLAGDPTVDQVALSAKSRQVGLHLRLVDRTWVDDGSVYVLLPESPRAAAEILIERIRATAPDLLPADVRVATFPDDGLTSGAIIAAVHDASVGEGPIPIRTTVVEGGELPAHGRDDELGGAVIRS